MFGAPDRLPVDLVLLVVSPVRERGRHLQLIARVKRIMNHPDLCMRLRNAQTRAEAAALLHETLAECKSMLRPFNGPAVSLHNILRGNS